MAADQPKAPLQGRYWFTVTFVLLALVPDLVLSTAMSLARFAVVRDLHTTPQVLGLGETFSNAGWALGAVVASYLALHYPTYKLNMIYLAMFIIGSVLGLVAPTPAFVVAGRILQGIATGMLLVSALPPLIRNFPVERLRTTATFVGIGFFGAAVAGPIIGGYVAQTDTWRWLFGGAALFGLGAFVLAYLVVQRDPGYNPKFPLDVPAVVLSVLAAGLTFYGVGAIQHGGWRSPVAWVPTAIGLLSIVVLIVYQYRNENALMPVRPIATTYPVMGILAGIVGGLAFTALTNVILVELLQGHHLSPLETGLVFVPGLVAAILGSILFGYFFSSRYLLLLPPLGLVSLLVAAFLLTTTPATDTLGMYYCATGLMGLGAGLTVSPGLFMAGLSVNPQIIGRAFALVELLRLAGAYAFVPAFEYFTTIYGTTPSNLTLGAHVVFWVVLIIIAVAMALITLVFVLGGARIQAPDLRAYLERNQPALESPPVFGRRHPSPVETLRAATETALHPGGGEVAPRTPQSQAATPDDSDRAGLSDDGRRKRNERQPTGAS